MLAEAGMRADCSIRPTHHVACESARRGPTERSPLEAEPGLHGNRVWMNPPENKPQVRALELPRNGKFVLPVSTTFESRSIPESQASAARVRQSTGLLSHLL